MKKQYIFILVLVIIISFCGCVSNAQSTETETIELGIPVMSATAGIYGVNDENYPKIDGSTSTLPIVQAIHEVMYKEGGIYPETASKTVPSYELLINGEVDLILVPYASTDVLALAEQNGVNLEFFPIALEALVFITPIENTVENITMEQVRDIYIHYGIKNWSELGGPDRNLIPICRNADSGSQAALDETVLNNEEIHPDIKKNYKEMTMDGMVVQVAFYHTVGSGVRSIIQDKKRDMNSYALGYTLYTWYIAETGMTGFDQYLRVLSFEGVEPNNDSIVDGSYPLSIKYYAVVRSDLSEEHSARSVIDFLQSEEGAKSINWKGLIPIVQ